MDCGFLIADPDPSGEGVVLGIVDDRVCGGPVPDGRLQAGDLLPFDGALDDVADAVRTRDRNQVQDGGRLAVLEYEGVVDALRGEGVAGLVLPSLPCGRRRSRRGIHQLVDGAVHLQIIFRGLPQVVLDLDSPVPEGHVLPREQGELIGRIIAGYRIAGDEIAFIIGELQQPGPRVSDAENVGTVIRGDEDRPSQILDAERIPRGVLRLIAVRIHGPQGQIGWERVVVHCDIPAEVHILQGRAVREGVLRDRQAARAVSGDRDQIVAVLEGALRDRLDLVRQDESHHGGIGEIPRRDVLHIHQDVRIYEPVSAVVMGVLHHGEGLVHHRT